MTDSESIVLPSCPRCGGTPIVPPSRENPFLGRPRRITCRDCGTELDLEWDEEESPPSARIIWDLDR